MRYGRLFRKIEETVEILRESGDAESAEQINSSAKMAIIPATLADDVETGSIIQMSNAYIGYYRQNLTLAQLDIVKRSDGQELTVKKNPQSLLGVNRIILEDLKDTIA